MSKDNILQFNENHKHPLFIRPLERRVMLDAAFGETFDPETTTTFEGGSFEDSTIGSTGKILQLEILTVMAMMIYLF